MFHIYADPYISRVFTNAANFVEDQLRLTPLDEFPAINFRNLFSQNTALNIIFSITKCEILLNTCISKQYQYLLIYETWIVGT